jgi:flagellar motility protein MotE (MotC chaperone)
VHAQPRTTETVPVIDETKSPSVREKGLMNNLLEKQKQLDNREKLLKEEERKIEELKKEVAEKMETLRVLQENMSASLEVQKVEKDKKYQMLAKMYEVTPPEKAAAIFEKMDRKMAAEIMLRMNSKKAGAIWAHINHETGVQIAREITSSQSMDTAKATKIAKEITGVEAIKQEAVQSPDVGAATSAEETKGAEAVKPETQQSLDSVGSPGTAKEIAVEKVIKPEPSQKAGAKSAAKKEIKIAKSKKAKLKNVQPQALKPFAIQIKAVRGIEMATEFTKLLKDEGVDAYWSEMSAKDGGTLYRILVGRFASREEALTYMKRKRIDINYPGSYIQKSEQRIPKKEEKKK